MKKKKDKKLEAFIDLIKQKKGLDLNLYRSTFLLRRINLRMTDCKVTSLDEYAKLLIDNSLEWSNFLKKISVNVSNFFRDADVYDSFNKLCLAEIVKHKEKLNQNLINWTIKIK